MELTPVNEMSLDKLIAEKADLEMWILDDEWEFSNEKDIIVERLIEVDDAILRHNNLTINYPPTANVGKLSINDLEG